MKNRRATSKTLLLLFCGTISHVLLAPISAEIVNAVPTSSTTSSTTTSATTTGCKPMTTTPYGKGGKSEKNPDPLCVPIPPPVLLPPVTSTDSGTPTSTDTTSKTLVDITAADPDLTLLVSAVQTAGLVNALSAPGSFTLFQPTNQAIAQSVGSTYWAKLQTPAYTLHLQNLLTYHVTTDTLNISSGTSNTGGGRQRRARRQLQGRSLATTNSTLTMLNGETVAVSQDDAGVVTLTSSVADDTVTLSTSPASASNGVAYKLNDGILEPSFLGRDLYDTISQDPNYSTLATAIQKAGLESAVRSGEYTVLAPDNNAFAEANLSLDDPQALAVVLEYHVIDRVAPTASWDDGEALVTLSGVPLEVGLDATTDTVTLDQVPVTRSELLAKNGIVQGVSKVLLPPSDVGTDSQSPVVAPAFDGPPFGPVTWQAVPLMPAMAPSSVMNPPSMTGGDEPTAVDTTPPAPTAAATIVDLVVADADLSTLKAAVVAAELADLLASPGPYTVLAPVNAAFAAVDPDLLAKLLTPEFQLHLQNLLAFHVTNGGVLSTDLTDGMSVTMLNGESVNVTIAYDGSVSFSSDLTEKATVVAADILASNGVVHTLDSVLVPSFIGRDLVDGLSSDPNYSTLVSLLQTAGLEDAIRSGTYTILAPNNAAFEAVPAATLESLSSDVEALKAVLTYHVIEGVAASNTLKTGPVVTLNGKSVDIVVNSDGSITIDGTAVVQPDLLAVNGIVHGIAAVLIPPSDGVAGSAVPMPTSVPPPLSAPTTGQAQLSAIESASPASAISTAAIGVVFGFLFVMLA